MPFLTILKALILIQSPNSIPNTPHLQLSYSPTNPKTTNSTISPIHSKGSTAAAPGETMPLAQNESNEATQTRMATPRPDSAHSSTQYLFDELDDAFLEELDALESCLCEPVQVPDTSSSVTEPPPDNAADRPTLAPESGTSSRKRSRSTSCPAETDSPRKKNKKNNKEKKVDLNAGVTRVLADFEDELSCPICCDIFAAAHLGNPCGHTFCGECGWSWICQNKMVPSCAVCRTKLVPETPMIPNFAMDNTVEKHVSALAASGHVEWQPGGPKYKEWTQRKDQWKAGAAKRAAGTRRCLSATFPSDRHTRALRVTLFDVLAFRDTLSAIPWMPTYPGIGDENYVDLLAATSDENEHPVPAPATGEDPPFRGNSGNRRPRGGRWVS